MVQTSTVQISTSAELEILNDKFLMTAATTYADGSGITDVLIPPRSNVKLLSLERVYRLGG